MSSRHAGAHFIDPLHRVVDGPALWEAYCEGLKAQGLSVDIIPVDKDDWCWSSQNGMAHCMCTKTILVEPSLLLGIRWWVRWSRVFEFSDSYSKAADARFSTAHTHTDILGFKKQRHAQGRKNAFLPSWPCFYLIRCDCHMLMSDYSAWGRTPRWTRKQNALLGIFRHLGKMLLKQMHPESNLQHFPSQAWVSRGDDERLECFFMQHMDIWHLKKRWLPVIANLVWAPFGGSVFHFQYETWSNFFGHLWTHARKAVKWQASVLSSLKMICLPAECHGCRRQKTCWMLYHCQCHIMWFWRFAFWSWIACLQLLRAIWSVFTHLNTPMEEHAK